MFQCPASNKEKREKEEDKMKKKEISTTHGRNTIFIVIQGEGCKCSVQSFYNGVPFILFYLKYLKLQLGAI